MQQLGPYKLEAVLGRGGMGTVYRAIDTETGAVLAVKVLAPVYSTDSHFRSRFESEIKALLKLGHPNIVRLISFGQDDANLYFAMELVDGKSLYQLQRDGEKFHWREVIRIAKNVTLGLRHAHEQGIVHRDLKPGNLLKANSGIIKITDFGIAKSFGQSQNTGTNVVGTVDFMSPEQAKGLPVSFSSDLYSLGTVMFTLLTGRPPFSANSWEESMRNLTKVPAPPVSQISPDVPAALGDLIAHLLEKSPEKRIPTALSLYHRLKAVEQQLLDSSQAKTTERRSSNPSEQTAVAVDPKTDVDRYRGQADTIKQLKNEGAGEEAESDRQGLGPADSKAAAEERPAEIPEDFFTPVTEGERRKHQGKSSLPPVSPQSILGKVVLASGLLAVVALGAYGVYRVSRPPTPAQLLAEIEPSWDQPQRRLEQIEQFLNYYPQHEKADALRERRDLARVYKQLGQLRSMKKSGLALSELQEQYLAVIDRFSDDLDNNCGILRAFVLLYDRDSLNAADQENLVHAKTYLRDLEQRAQQQISKLRSVIERQFKQADGMARLDAIVVYKSIVELNRDFEWAADLVKQAEEKIGEYE